MSKSKYTYDKDWYDSSEHSSYVLGWILARGKPNKSALRLQTTLDEPILKLIRSTLKYTGPVYKHAINIPDFILPDYSLNGNIVRGIYDACGSLHDKNGIRITVHQDLADQIRDEYLLRLNVFSYQSIRYTYSQKVCLHISHRPDILSFLSSLYVKPKKDCFYLERKFDKFKVWQKKRVL